jgi:hypothetical protein
MLAGTVPVGRPMSAEPSTIATDRPNGIVATRQGRECQRKSFAVCAPERATLPG